MRLSTPEVTESVADRALEKFRVCEGVEVPAAVGLLSRYVDMSHEFRVFE